MNRVRKQLVLSVSIGVISGLLVLGPSFIGPLKHGESARASSLEPQGKDNPGASRRPFFKGRPFTAVLRKQMGAFGKILAVTDFGAASC